VTTSALLTTSALADGTNDSFKYNCSLKGNYVSPWGLASSVDTTMVLSSEDDRGMNSDQIDASISWHTAGSAKNSAFDVSINAPGVNNFAPGRVVDQILRFPAGSPPSTVDAESHQNFEGTCTHIANQNSYLCDLTIESTGSWGDMVIQKQYKDLIVDQTFYSDTGETAPAPSAAGLTQLPQDAARLVSDGIWDIYAIQNEAAGKAVLSITGNEDKRIGNFELDPTSGKLQKMSSHYAVQLHCAQ